MKKSSCLVLNFFPRGGDYFPGSELRRTASDFFLPSHIRVRVHDLIETGNQASRKLCPLVFRQGKRFL